MDKHYGLSNDSCLVLLNEKLCPCGLIAIPSIAPIRTIHPDAPYPLLIKTVCIDVIISSRLDRLIGLRTTRGININFTHNFPGSLYILRRCVPLVVSTQKRIEYWMLRVDKVT